MICSSEFSLDENSAWDPKAIRQLLIISEDQLNILSNIPEWTKESDDNYYSRIKANDSCLNTQIELNPSSNLLRSQEVINHNIELFNKNLDFRDNIIQTYKLNTLKFSKSTSLFEIDKITKNSHCGNHLSFALSLPNLSVFSKDFSGQFENKSYLSQKSNLSTQFNLGSLNTDKSKTCTENPNMEVVSQLPAVPQIITNNENFAIVDKSVLSESQAIQSSDNSSNSCDLIFVSENVKLDHLSSIETKTTNVVEIVELSDNKNVALLENKPIVCNNNNLDFQENSIEIEPTNLNLHKKMETDSSIARESTINNSIHNTNEKIKLSELEGLSVEKNELQITVEENVINNANANPLNKNKNSNFEGKIKILNEVNETSLEISNQPEKNELQVILEERVINNASSINKDKNSNTEFEGKILSKDNEIPEEVSKQLGVDPKLSESKVTVVSSDELESKITNSSYDSKMNAEIVLKTTCRGAGDGEAVTLHSLPLKRKSESKARSSKKSRSSREKQGSDERSIKKACEIYYSAEDMKMMFDLLKLFL